MIHRLRLYSKSLIHILSLSNLRNNVACSTMSDLEPDFESDLESDHVVYTGEFIKLICLKSSDQLL